MYEVIFNSGSLKGRRWRVPDGGTLAVGRSHSCEIRLKEPDVSGKHALLREEGGVLWLEVLSSHKTTVDGIRLPAGEKIALTEVSQVSLGGGVTFKVGLVSVDADAETGEIIPGETATLGGTGTVATAATRAADTAMLGGETGALGATGTMATAATRAADTAMLGGETGALGATGTMATAATRAANPATMATAATRAFRPAGGSGAGGRRTVAEADTETSFLASGELPGAKGAGSGETTDLNSEGGGETQMLHTQMASREELDKLKAAYQQRQKTRVARRFVLLGTAAAVALGASIWFSTRKPEAQLSQPKDYDSVTIIPDLAPADLRGSIAGKVGLAYPSKGASKGRSDNSVEIRTRIGKKLDVEVVVAADVFEDEAALGESREATFMRYISKSQELVKILDNMYPLPDEDFFGGKGGRLRGVPCSRVEYWRLRGRENVYGVVSFFRSGTLCCAVRREVPAAEKERAAGLLLDTRDWLYADGGGVFSASQWEGAEGAGCAEPALEISRCEARFAVDSPAEWPEIERGLRDILAETWGDEGYSGVRERALKLLADLRARKALNWKRLVASRVPITLPGGGTTDRRRASELDEAVKNDYPSPDEEWYFLARRIRWWRE